jgi:TolA-binding protein
MRLCLVVLLTVAGSAGVLLAQAGSSRAAELIKNRQYADAIRVLQDELENKGDAEAARLSLMLGECHYMVREYEKARTAFARAVRHLPEGREKIIAEYRLACTAYRLRDFAGAQQRIDAFIAAYPKDERVGKLLGYKMLILAEKGPSVQKDLEALHKQIYSNIGLYDAITGMEADEILCNFYKKQGQHDKAEELYTRIVLNFRNVINEHRREKRPLPQAVEKAHDNAALQLGIIALERKNPTDAAKWLANVSYDQDMKVRARLLLAKLAFDRRDYRAAVESLTAGDFIDTVPAGPIKSDMHLILGMAEKNRPDGNAARVEEYLRKVGPDSKGFQQAQAALGDIYRQKGLTDKAVECYKNVLESPDYASNALFYLAQIYFRRANEERNIIKSREMYKEVAKLLSRLHERYPLSPLKAQSKEMVEALATKSIDVSFAQDAGEMVKGWQKTAAEKAGSFEAAQALLSLMQHHFKSLKEEKTSRFIKAPDYVACAAACDQLLDERKYQGSGFAEADWKNFKGEIYYHRGLCELASIGQAKLSGEGQPTYLAKALAAQAAEFLGKARALVNPKQLDVVKGIELALLESLFKSDKPQDREAAEKRFGELEADYGSDQRFQKLAMELADWCMQQNRLPDAARHYAGVADRGKELGDEDLMRLYYTAGTLYSKAAYESQQKPGNMGYAIYIYPKEVISLGDDLLKRYPPLRKTVELSWPQRGQNVPAKEALVALSKAANVPFVWTSDKGANSVATYLDSRKLSLPESGKGTVAELLGLVLDLQRHRLDFDIGLTDGQPTLKPAALADDPDAEQAKVIEIYDMSQAATRYKPLGRLYGPWSGAARGREVMLLHVLQKVEEVSKTHILWAEGVEQQVKLAFSYRQSPAGIPADMATCAQVLTAALDAADLRYRVVQREAAADLYEAAKDCFNKIRRIGPTSKFGERSLFSVALNFYNLREYQKMKQILREYLKSFDNPANEFYHEANFWVGWAFENERKYRDAAGYYARSAEEFVIVEKPANGKPPTRAELRARLSYDSLAALAEPVAGVFNDLSLQGLADFIRYNTHISVKLDPSVVEIRTPTTRPAFKGVPAFDVLCDALEPLGLTFRVDNLSPQTAEKAYFRLAWVYRKDNLLQQAKENCQLLLDRYPQTGRKRDAQRLLLDIHRGLRNFAQVLSLLQELRSSAADDAEKRQLEMEIAWIHFDMADYAGAVKAFNDGLAAARAEDQFMLRDGLARALWRLDKNSEALAEYETLAKAQVSPLRLLTYKLLGFYLKVAVGKAQLQEFPQEADRDLLKYEKLSDEQRSALPAAELAKATWIYYVKALLDLHVARTSESAEVRQQRTADALERLAAVINSPDETIAADAGYLVGMIHLRQGNLPKAKEAFEYLLFATRSSESAVRATYWLGVCFERLNQPAKAVERYQQVVSRYPLSPLAAEVKKNPLYEQWLRTRATAPATQR